MIFNVNTVLLKQTVRESGYCEHNILFVFALTNEKGHVLVEPFLGLGF